MNQSTSSRCSGGVLADGGDERSVLLAVLLVAGAQVPVVGRGGVGDGVELVVAEDDLGGAGVDHAPHDVDRLELLRAPIDQVADEDRLPPRVPPRAVAFGVAHRAQESGERVGVAVHVSDHVVPGHGRLAQRVGRGRVRDDTLVLRDEAGGGDGVGEVGLEGVGVAREGAGRC